ncbi:MAG: AMP-binding protein [Actinomycetes bacterium]|jgi:fatty-acyl-CoA synthase
MFVGTYAASAPDRPAVIMGQSGEIKTYKDVNDASIQFARVLRGCGLKPGDHFAVMMENHARYFEIVWAGMRSGFYITAVNAHLTPEEVGYIVNDSQAKVLITTASLASVAESVRELTPLVERRFMVDGTVDGYESYEETIAHESLDPLESEQRGLVMLYSSGTTGRPKGIKFPLPPEDSPLGEWEIGQHSSNQYGFGEDMVFLNTAPLYHAAPLRTSLAVQSVGGTVVVMEKFDPTLALQLIERERVTHSQWVPTMFIRMLKLPEEVRLSFDLSSQRVTTHAAAPCPVHVKEQMIDWWGPILHEYYAGTEDIGSTAITSEEWLEHKGSVGRPSRGGIVHICDEDGNELPTGETGAIYFEDSLRSVAYHGDEKKTRSIEHPDHPTWRCLGDIGRVDEDGYLYLTDRKAFMIVAGGVNIYPQEIEDVLLAHPKVLDVAVFGVPNEELGEEVKAVVQPMDPNEMGDALGEELRAWCQERLAKFKVPRSFDFDAQLPRLDNGKLYKSIVRDRYWEGKDSRVL